MKCKRPVVFNKKIRNAPSPCGQCQHCRTNQRRVWTHRIILEAMQHPQNTFLTLTYDDDHLPREEFYHKKTGEVFAPLSVNPYSHKKFIDNLRWHYRDLTGKEFRYYMVGEYGEKSQRPHYHYALFGFPQCTIGAQIIQRRFFACRCSSCSLISRVWGQGNIYQGSLTSDSAAYIAGYINKKLTNGSDYRQPEYQGYTNKERLAGRHPEFSRMSNRPGIANLAVDNIVKSLSSFNSEDYSLPQVLIHGTKSLPLGRYLSDKIHEKLGITFEPGEKVRKYEASLRSLLLSEAKNHIDVARASYSSVEIALEFLNIQHSINLEKKRQLYTKEKAL